MTYTIEYPTTGAFGCETRPVTNRLGRFDTEAEAEAHLARAKIEGGKVVPSPSPERKMLRAGIESGRVVIVPVGFKRKRGKP